MAAAPSRHCRPRGELERPLMRSPARRDPHKGNARGVDWKTFTVNSSNLSFTVHSSNLSFTVSRTKHQVLKPGAIPISRSVIVLTWKPHDGKRDWPGSFPCRPSSHLPNPGLQPGEPSLAQLHENALFVKVFWVPGPAWVRKNPRLSTAMRQKRRKNGRLN